MANCEECASSRKAQHSEKEKKELITRLNRIEGQIRGITKMINEDVYCNDILNQITSVKAAITSTQSLLLKKHINSCVVSQIKEGQLGVIDELIATIERIKK